MPTGIANATNRAIGGVCLTVAEHTLVMRSIRRGVTLWPPTLISAGHPFLILAVLRGGAAVLSVVFNMSMGVLYLVQSVAQTP